MRRPESDQDATGEQTPHQSYTDAEYVAGIQAGNTQIFNALVLAYYTLLVRFAAAMIRFQDAAEDIVQDVLCRIWEQRATWTPRGPLRAYLLRAVRNHALDWLKHAAVEERYRYEHAAQDDLQDDLAPAADLALIQAQDSAALAQALAQLPERRRLVVQLRYYQQLSHADIGEVLGISPKAVKELLHRTIEALRQRLAPPG